jgi:molybdopterin-guanine dinucleotide biosynthesis protein A
MHHDGAMTWAAVILTGGTASRLGGVDKAALDRAGRSLLEHALTAVAEAAEVVVVGPETATTAPVRFAREDPPGGGPLAGVAAGVAALTGAHDLVLVLAVDMPHVTARTCARLVAAVGDADGAWLVDADGRRQLAGVVRPALVPAAGEAAGVPMRRLMGAGRVVDVPALGDEAADVDTWPDAGRLGVVRRGEATHDEPRAERT